MMHEVIVRGIVFGVITGACTMWLWMDYRSWPKELNEPPTFDVPTTHRGHDVLFEDRVPKTAMGIDLPYSVAGKPRRERWSVKKKELEAAAKQKRKQLESFREIE